MGEALLFGLMLLFFFHIASSQEPLSSQGSAATTTSVSLTPEMSASAVSSLYSVLATSSPQQPGNGEYGEGRECEVRLGKRLIVDQDRQREMLGQQQGAALEIQRPGRLELTPDLLHFREVQ
jgi:hypothetical protein